MGLDSYIIKCKEKNISDLREQIFKCRKEALASAGASCDGFVFLVGEQPSYMDRFNPDIYWRKFNHVTAWFLEKVDKKLPQRLGFYVIGVDRYVLLMLRNDCARVINRCVRSSGRIKIDERYCKKAFPCLDVAFSGSADYDEDFIAEVRKAMNDIDKLLLTSSEQDDYYVFVIDA